MIFQRVRQYITLVLPPNKTHLFLVKANKTKFIRPLPPCSKPRIILGGWTQLV